MPLFLSFPPEFPVLSGIFWKKGALREPSSSKHCCGQRLAHVPQPIQTSVIKKVFFRNRSFFKHKTLAADGTLPKIKELNAPLRNNKDLEDIMRIPRITSFIDGFSSKIRSIIACCSASASRSARPIRCTVCHLPFSPVTATVEFARSSL